VQGPSFGRLGHQFEDADQATVVLAQLGEGGAPLVGALGRADVAFEGALGQGEQAISLGPAELALDAIDPLEQPVGEVAPFGVLPAMLKDPISGVCRHAG
jgi:hypothetical protein